MLHQDGHERLSFLPMEGYKHMVEENIDKYIMAPRFIRTEKNQNNIKCKQREIVKA